MKLVEITARRVPVNGKMLGKGGKYKVTDAEAAAIVRNRDGKVVQDLGEDETSGLVSGQETKVQEFLQMLHENRHEVLTILQTASQERFDMEGEEVGQENVEKSQTDNASQSAKQTDPADKSDAPDGSEKSSTNENESEKENEKGTPLPEHFPSKDKLEEAGFNTIESIPRDKQKLLDAGLSDRSAKAVESRLVDLLGE